MHPWLIGCPARTQLAVSIIFKFSVDFAFFRWILRWLQVTIDLSDFLEKMGNFFKHPAPIVRSLPEKTSGVSLLNNCALYSAGLR